MVESLLKQCFVYSVHTEISQFFQGLNSIGNLGDMIMGNKLLFDTILNNQHPRLTKAVFMSLCEYNRSEEGSNKREEEDKTIYSFEVFLQDLEEGEVACLSLENLLVFITAADCVPPLGFDKLVTIDLMRMFVAVLMYQPVGCISFYLEDLKTQLPFQIS